MRRLLVVSLIAICAAVPLAPVVAGPVKCSDLPTPDGRVFPEPRVSATFLRFDEFRCGMATLEDRYPWLMETTVVGFSGNRHPIYDILLTDERIPRSGKQKLLVVSSIHGGEVGGREGAVRVIEDMVDPRFLGDEGWVHEVLDRYVIHFLFPNPDGWVNGDLVGTPGAGVATTRGNRSGRDLNRQFPVKGYIYAPNRTLAEPEGNEIITNMFADPDGWYLGTDNHGQGPDTYAAAGLQIVGQFDYQKSETLARFADDIDDAMAEYDVLGQLQTIKDVTGEDIGPYHWGTLYDMLGYSASGSMIDWYNTVDGVSGTGFATELTVGTEVNAAGYPGLMNQVWVDSIRAINYTMFRHAIDPVRYTYDVGGKTAYVFDPEVIRHDDANGSGYVRREGEDIPQRPYRVTRMRFFEDLNRYASQELTPIRVKQLVGKRKKRVSLRRFDTVILANDAMPAKGDADRYFGKLRGWVERGGNLVVTDAAVSALPAMGVLPADAVDSVKRYVGYVDFEDREHPLAANLRGVARQTYDSVPIGYAFPPAGNNCPVWRVDRSAWEAAGGQTVGTNGAGRTAFGQLPLGQGMVRFIGALLPDPTEEFYHPYGLQSYAVTYTGYTILQNSLEWDNPKRVVKRKKGR